MDKWFTKKKKKFSQRGELIMKENLFDTKKEIISNLKKSEDELTQAKSELKNKENDIWLNTKFKKLGYTNDDTRRAYVSQQTDELRVKEELIRNRITELKRELDLVDDKIKLFSF